MVPKHQEHKIPENTPTFVRTGYDCETVIAQEHQFGPHIDGCSWVGYVPSSVCCVKVKRETAS